MTYPDRPVCVVPVVPEYFQLLKAPFHENVLKLTDEGSVSGICSMSDTSGILLDVYCD